MSNCGNCRSGICTCIIQGNGTTTEAFGIGSSYDPFQIRPISPDFRPVGVAFRTTGQAFTLNTDTAIIFQASELPFTGAGDMWNVALPTRLTAPVNGLYLVGGIVTIDSGAVSNVWVAKNGVVGTPQVRRTNTIQSGGVIFPVSVMTLLRLTAGEYIELFLRTDVSSSTSIEIPSGDAVGTDLNPYFWANWMSD